MVMTKRKGSRRKFDPTVVRNPLTRWTTEFSSRGNKVFELEASGPVVSARTPEELAQRTKEATEREGTPDVN